MTNAKQMMSEAERKELFRKRLYKVLPLLSLGLLLLLWLYVSGGGQHSSFPSPEETWNRFLAIMRRPSRA